MTRFSCPILTYILAMLFLGLVSASCTREDDSKPAMPRAAAATAAAAPVERIRLPQAGRNETASNGADLGLKIRQWETIQDAALANYDLCLENCGKASECAASCRQAYVQGLAAEYKMLIDK